MSSCRGVCVADVAGKIHHSWLRAKMLPHLEYIASDTMCGGIGQRGTDLAGFHVRQFVASSRAKGSLPGLLFIDVSGAFDAV
eukprot:11107783-Alexandrium_andersonii.AAC.1